MNDNQRQRWNDAVDEAFAGYRAETLLQKRRERLERITRLRRRQDTIELILALWAIGLCGVLALAPLAIWWGQQ